ncbi:WD40 repeat-like protein [Backusella circina FSU 941]|nr:WD40 repeat-like protein [Backusella circina FSU 941]
MVQVSSEYISVGCNRTAHAACWGVDGLVAFGADKLIALYSPLDTLSKGVQETLPGHTGRVICLNFIERGNEDDLKDVALISGSADFTAKIWKMNQHGKWINSATLKEHTGAVETIACLRAHSIESDHDMFATGSSDGTIRIWERRVVNDDTDEVVCKQVINNGNKYPMSLALSYLPESKVPILVSGHTDKLISVYICKENEFVKVHTLQGHDNWVRDLAFATYTGSENAHANNLFQKGDLMLASGSQDKYIRLWKISLYNPVKKEEDDEKESENVDSDLMDALKQSELSDEQLSTKAHVVSVDVGQRRILKKENSQKQYSFMFEALLMGHDDWVFSIQWQRPQLTTAADGTRQFTQPLKLISASSDKSMMIWSPDEHTGVWVNEVRMGDIGGSAYLGFCGAFFSPDGKYVASHGANGSFHVWKNISEASDENRWVPQVAISGHFKSVESIAWDPHSRYLLSASLDQTTRLFAPWNRELNGKQVTTWHEMGRPQVHGYDIKCVAFSNEWQFVSGADEKVLRVFDAPKSCVESLALLTSENSLLDHVESRPIGANLPALGLSNKAVFEGDVNEMEQAQDNHNMYQSYTSAPSTPTALMDVMSHPPFEEHLIQHTLWPEVEKLSRRLTLSILFSYGHLYEIMSVDVSSDGKYVASTCKASTPEHAVVRLFDTEKWKEAKNGINAHTLTATRVRFSHNGRWLLSVSRDRLWSISERNESDPDTPYKLVAKNKAHARIIWDCSWSHDDRFFITGSRDKTVKIWSHTPDNKNWTCVATIKCTEAVTAVDFAPALVDDKYVVALGLENGHIQLLSSVDNEANEWTQWHNVDERLCHFGVVRSLTWRNFNQDNTLQLASAGEDHSVRILNVKY